MLTIHLGSGTPKSCGIFITTLNELTAAETSRQKSTHGCGQSNWRPWKRSALWRKLITDRSGPVRAPACFITSISLASTGAKMMRPITIPATKAKLRGSCGHGAQWRPSPAPSARHNSPLQLSSRSFSGRQHSLQPSPLVPGQHRLPTTSRHVSGRYGLPWCSAASVGLVS